MSESHGSAAGGAGAALDDPDEIVRHAGLSQEQKRELLHRLRERQHGSAAGAGSILERIGRALEFLDSETGGRQQTHEQVLHGPGTAPVPEQGERERKA